jgi:tRNA threonylcarbamoyladenosine biosynthesis protein TsaE
VKQRALVVRTTSPVETRRLGEALGRVAQGGDAFLIEGSFGVGKTVLVQGIAAGLGIEEPITSPSFVLMVEHRGRVRLLHVDLYRLDGRLDDEILDALADAREADTVSAVEWPEAVPADLREGATVVRMTALDESTREIAVEAHSERIAATVRSALEAR